jgi:hypothetical protein
LKILAHWSVTAVNSLSDAVLANGVKVKDTDLNDLVAVKEFQGAGTEMPAGVERNVTSFFTMAQKAGDEIGFRLFWPYILASRTNSQRNVNFGLDYWNTRKKTWEPILDQAANGSLSKLVTRANGIPQQSIDVRMPATRPGVYRFTIAGAGSDTHLAGLNYDVAAGTYAGTMPMTYTFNKVSCSGAGRAYFYIPKGTKSLDLEVSVSDKADKTLVFYSGLPATGMKESRRIVVSGIGAHRIALQPGEDGSLAHIEPASGDTFYFPYLYSVPLLWARSSDTLLVPRAIAKADGLTILPGE